MSWICRDIQRVLQEDRDKLVQLQKNQPRFSEQQKEELMEVHSWIKKGVLPEVFDKVDWVASFYMGTSMPWEPPCHGNLHAMCLLGCPGLFLLR